MFLECYRHCVFEIIAVCKGTCQTVEGAKENFGVGGKAKVLVLNMKESIWIRNSSRGKDLRMLLVVLREVDVLFTSMRSSSLSPCSLRPAPDASFFFVFIGFYRILLHSLSAWGVIGMDPIRSLSPSCRGRLHCWSIDRSSFDASSCTILGWLSSSFIGFHRIEAGMQPIHSSCGHWHEADSFLKPFDIRSSLMVGW